MSDRKNGRMTSWARRCALALCIASLPVLCGCVILGIGAVGAAVGGGAIVYVKGNLTQTLYSPEMKVHDATVKALNELKLPIVLDRSDVMTAKLESEFADGTRLWIDLKAVNSENTDVLHPGWILGRRKPGKGGPHEDPEPPVNVQSESERLTRYV